MPTNYPGSLDTTTQLPNDRANATPTVDDHAEDHNNLADAVIAIETELGVNPSGAAATVAAALALKQDASSAATQAELDAEAATRLAADNALDGRVDTLEGSTALADHIADAADAHDASAISFAPAGSIAATDVQTAIAEAASEAATALSDHTGDATAAHAATAISFAPDGSIAATTVQAAIQEVRDEAAGSGSAIVPIVAGNLGATYTLDQDGNEEVALEGTLNANCALTWNDWPAGYSRATLSLTQDATGSRTLSINGTGVTIPTTPLAAMEVDLSTFDGGSTIHVAVPGATGPQGPQGEQGEQGETGPAGNAAASPFIFRTGRWYASFGFGSPTTTFNPVNGRLYAMPFLVAESTTFDRIAMEVTSGASAGGVFRLGIYADDGDGYPGALILDAGTVVTTSNGLPELTISQVLTPGLYWLSGAEQGAPVTGATVRGWSPSNNAYLPPIGRPTAGMSGNSHLCYQPAGITGALPNPFTAAASSTTSAPVVSVRAA